MNELGLVLYIIFTISWFLHLGTRIPILGIIRFDLILVILLIIISYINRNIDNEYDKTEVDSSLIILIAYSIITLPLAEWPGSVIRYGIPNFIKAVVFYYFTIIFITNEKKLKLFIFVYLICQTYRVIEPLYLHITSGYWGSFASMEGGEVLLRLSGGPSDTINPNGLAAVIVTIIPFYYFLSELTWKNKIILVTLLPVFIYALLLTASRSGMIGLAIILMGIIYLSKKRYLIMALTIIAFFIIFPNLSPDQQDRYLSIFQSNTKNAATAEGRLTGTLSTMKLILHKPIIGHGLGTSAEANANYGNMPMALMPHNLFIEVGIELGLIGLILFLKFMKSIIMNYLRCYKMLKIKYSKGFLMKINEAMLILLLLNIVMSFASYGLNLPGWYLFAGLSVVIMRISKKQEYEIIE